ncbi:MAG TPA: hypothetical protein VGH30_08015 [Jatrophihabitantaceae bacterium]
MAEHDGTLADEAMRLIGAMQDWARQNFPAGPDGHGVPSGAVCQWCPLCQFMAVLRGERPEVTARVADAGTAVASAFRAVLDAAATRPSDPPESRVQHIDLSGNEPP